MLLGLLSIYNSLGNMVGLVVQAILSDLQYRQSTVK